MWTAAKGLVFLSFAFGLSLSVGLAADRTPSMDMKNLPDVTIRLSDCSCIGRRCVCPKIAPQVGHVSFSSKQMRELMR